MESLNGEGSMDIVHATIPAADINPVCNIKPAENKLSNHVPGSPNTSEDSTSDGSRQKLDVPLIRAWNLDCFRVALKMR